MTKPLTDRQATHWVKIVIGRLCKCEQVWNDLQKDKKTRRLKFRISDIDSNLLTSFDVGAHLYRYGVDFIEAKVVPAGSKFFGQCGYIAVTIAAQPK